MMLADETILRESLDRDLKGGLISLGLRLDEQARSQLLLYLALLHKWNKVHNLTAIRDPLQMVGVHLLDSLSVTTHIPEGQVLDVGSGAGLPGIPLAIALQDRHFTLVESIQKKAAFIRQAAAELKIGNISVVAQKVESWRPENRFNCIVSRAYAEIATLIQSTRHLLAPRGIYAAMKGRYPTKELASIPQDFRVREVIALDVPGLDAERHLILLEKT